MKKYLIAALAGAAFLSTPASAEVIVDSNGNGFVGKGDVQLALGYNNAQLQQNANSLVFSLSSTTEVTWTCDRDAGPQTQERTNVTTTQGIIASVARVRNQITGFNLQGFTGTTTTTTDGPAVGSCPEFWTAIDLVETPGEGGTLSVNGVPLN